ncbi:MAG: hypothetical protein L3J74_17270, partial [Bacteroidales bacterium]|nr:hypothetical protein [Bacteroidales bacterium]
PDEYPLQPKKHSLEFLREKAYLRYRTSTFSAIARVRHAMIFAVHNFFNERNFYNIHTPIITGSDAEGAGEMFQVTTLNMENVPKTDDGKVDYKKDFFGKSANLTVSGQLEGELAALALSKIYTFGPTFRAENSNTTRHLAEFWMIEPEMAFYNNEMNMDLIEKFIKYIVKTVKEQSSFEFSILERDTAIFDKIAGEKFPRLTYDQAVRILRGEEKVNGKTTIETLENDLKEVLQKIQENHQAIEDVEKEIKGGVKKGKRNYLQNKIDTLKNEIKDLEERKRVIPQWVESAKNFKYGNDLGGSDETVLTRMFDLPVMVYNWPHEVKAFYMKRDEENPDLAKGVDVLAPEGYGEIVGGGERETDLDLLVGKIHEHKLPMEAFEWYLDLRRFGSVPHAGFGLGLERMVAWICKIKHIRETIPFPRMYGRLFP